MVKNNIVNWMFLRETTKGTSLLTAADTDNVRYFGLPYDLPPLEYISNQIVAFQPYSKLTPDLTYGNRAFPLLVVPHIPTCPYAEYLLLGGTSGGNTLLAKTTNMGLAPALTIRCEEKGGTVETSEKLSQYVGCQCVGLKKVWTNSKDGWKYHVEPTFAFEEFEDNSGASGTTQRVMLDSSHQPDYIGDTTGIDTQYSEPPIITYDVGGGGTNISSWIDQITVNITRNYSVTKISDTKQRISLGSFEPVETIFNGVLPTSLNLLNIIDKTTTTAYTIQTKKAMDNTKYITDSLGYTKYESQVGSKIANMDAYAYAVKLKSTTFATLVALEAGITFATWFT